MGGQSFFVQKMVPWKEQTGSFLAQLEEFHEPLGLSNMIGQSSSSYTSTLFLAEVLVLQSLDFLGKDWASPDMFQGGLAGISLIWSLPCKTVRDDSGFSLPSLQSGVFSHPCYQGCSLPFVERETCFAPLRELKLKFSCEKWESLSPSLCVRDCQGCVVSGGDASIAFLPFLNEVSHIWKFQQKYVPKRI